MPHVSLCASFVVRCLATAPRSGHGDRTWTATPASPSCPPHRGRNLGSVSGGMDGGRDTPRGKSVVEVRTWHLPAFMPGPWKGPVPPPLETGPRYTPLGSGRGGVTLAVVVPVLVLMSFTQQQLRCIPAVVCLTSLAATATGTCLWCGGLKSMEGVPCLSCVLSVDTVLWIA